MTTLQKSEPRVEKVIRKFKKVTAVGYQDEQSLRRYLIDEFDDIERRAEAARELLNMLQRMVDETAGGATPCLLTLEHARAAIDKAKGKL